MQAAAYLRVASLCPYRPRRIGRREQAPSVMVSSGFSVLSSAEMKNGQQSGTSFPGFRCASGSRWPRLPESDTCPLHSGSCQDSVGTHFAAGRFDWGA